MNENPTGKGYINLTTPGFEQRALDPTYKASVLDTFHKVQLDITGAKIAFRDRWKLNRSQRKKYNGFLKNGPKALEELHRLVPQLDQWEAEHQEEVKKMREDLHMPGDM